MHRRQYKIKNKRVEKASKPANGSKTGSGGLNLDLEVSAPSQVFIRGRGMDAELGGTITVKGNSASPLVSGGFQNVARTACCYWEKGWIFHRDPSVLAVI